MITTATLVCLALCATDAGGGDKPAIVVQCKPDAEIRGREVLLRDLADIRTSDPELSQRLLAISFGKRPAFGFNRVLSRNDILARLAREGIKAGRLKISGANQVVLHPILTRLRPQEVVEAAEPVLRAAIELEADSDIEFEVSGKVSALLVPPGRYSMELSPQLREGKLNHSSATVNITVLVDREEFKVVRVPFRLRRFTEVLVSSKAIKKGMPLADHNLELQRVESSPGTSPYLTGFDEVAGKVAAVGLQAGHKLTLGSLSDPAVVFRGEQVSLVSSSGRILVATRAIALQDGPVGALIAVRNLAANKIVQAKVRGSGLVVIPSLTTKVGKR